ncbi:Myb-like protein J, partial [Frankliniella fusca]
PGPSEQSKDNDSYSEGDDRRSVDSFGIDVISYDDDDDDHDGSQTAGNDEVGRTKSEKWCCCRSCCVLQKYECLAADPPKFKQQLSLPQFSEGYISTFEANAECDDVELTTGSGVFISASQKDQLKVDFRNKPTGLVRETLFALYGFVNRNVDKEKKIKLTDLSSLINKKAPEWRTITLPLKRTPQKTPQKTPLKTPQKTPLKTPLKTPVKSPLTKNSFTVQQPFDNQHSGWNVTSKQQNGVYEGSSTTGAWGPNYYSSYQYWNQAQQWGPPHRTQQWGPPHQTTADQSWEACSGPGPSLPQAEPSQYYNLQLFLSSLFSAQYYNY